MIDFHRLGTPGYTVLQGVTWCYTVLQAVRLCAVTQCFMLCYEVLHGVTRVLHGGTKLLHGVTGCYKVVTRC